MLITGLLFVLEVWDGKPTYRKSWAGNLLMWSDLTSSPSFNIKRGRPNLKVLITCLLLILEVCNVKPTHRKSWAGNLLIFLDLTFKVKLWFTGFGELSFRWIQICIGPPMRRSSYCKMLFIFETVLVGLFRWIHLASGHRCVLGLVVNLEYN